MLYEHGLIYSTPAHTHLASLSHPGPLLPQLCLPITLHLLRHHFLPPSPLSPRLPRRGLTAGPAGGGSGRWIQQRASVVAPLGLRAAARKVGGSTLRGAGRCTHNNDKSI